MPQETQYRLGYYFFAPSGRFDACGMFTFDHIVASLIAIAIVVAMLIMVKKNVFTFNKTKMLRFCAVLLTALECIKISHSFIYGDYHLDAWFPLSYCGLFIFALWMSGFAKGHIKRIGEVFIAYGCPIAGVAFLIFPTTSLMIFPIWHYFSLYSLFYHSLMMFVGLLLLSDEPKLDKNAFVKYAMFVIGFAIPAIIMNIVFGCNLMNLREPYNIPIQLIQDMYSYFSPLYTVVVIVLYMCMPFVTNLLKRVTK